MTAEGNGKAKLATVAPWSRPREARRFSNLSDLSVSYEGHSEDVAAHPPDLSTRGMFINTTRVFPEGAVLNIRFKLMNSGYEVRSRAEVRHCHPGVGVGVEFVDISQECVQAIEREIEASGQDSSA